MDMTTLPKELLSDKMRKARLNEIIVQNILENGGNAEDCVEALIAELSHRMRELSHRMRELMAVTMIAPRKIRRPDGTEYVWHCPDDLVPFTGIDLAKKPEAVPAGAKAEKKTITVTDMISHLLAMPPDMEVWIYWDEGGSYDPATKPQVRVDRLVEIERFGCKRWEEADEGADGKPVCVLMAPYK